MIMDPVMFKRGGARPFPTDGVEVFVGAGISLVLTDEAVVLTQFLVATTRLPVNTSNDRGCVARDQKAFG